MELRKRKAPTWKFRIADAVCKKCGKEFQYQRKSTKRAYCSEECKRLVDNERNGGGGTPRHRHKTGLIPYAGSDGSTTKEWNKRR